MIPPRVRSRKDQPVKFAAMECVQKTSTDVTEYIGGRCTSSGVKGGIAIPGLDSFLVGWSTSTQVTGLDSVPPDDRPPANTMLHWAFDAMVGICSLLIVLALWLGIGWWRKRDFPQSRWFLRATAVSGVASVVALECGWIVTEVGRQPWIVYNVMRTSDAVTQANGIWITFIAVLALYIALGAVLVITLRAMSRRWRNADEAGRPRALRPGRRPTRGLDDRGLRMSSADAVAVVLWIGATLYAVFGGADFGAGLWSLLAGGGERGRRPRELIDWAIGAVWEANHVWLIFVLVVFWTGFSSAFEAVFSTLFIPLSLAALGIVVRGSGFAFHHTARRARGRALAETLFGLASLLTPFFMGTVVGAIAGGRVPVGNATGDLVTSWLNPLSLVIGALFVATGAYLSAVFLVSDARRAGAPDLERYFSNRALASAVVTGALAAVGLVALHSDAHFVFDGLTSDGLPLVLLSLAAGSRYSCCFAAALGAEPGPWRQLRSPP